MSGTFARALALCSLSMLLLTGLVRAGETFEQKKARMQREFEQKTKAMNAQAAKSKTQLPPLPVPTKNVAVKTPQPAPRKPTGPSFNPQSAPAPEKCLDAYLKAARSASSMSQLLQYLRPSERSVLQDRQKNFDPKQALARRAQYQKEGMDRETIDHLTASPYETELKHAKAIANKVTAIQGVRVNGNEAKIEAAIQINDVINGKKYSRSTATIGMVGEGNNWYFTTFNESNFATR